MLARWRWPDAVFVLVGVLNLGFAGLGAEYVAAGWSIPRENTPELPYFVEAFTAMSATCAAFLAALALSGIGLIRRRRGWSVLTITTLFAEVAFVLCVGGLWLHPGWGRSIAAATGIASGGLMYQAVLLYPLTAPAALAAAWYGTRRQDVSTGNNLG